MYVVIVLFCSFMEHSKLLQVAKDDYLPSDAVREREGGRGREGVEKCFRFIVICNKCCIR